MRNNDNLTGNITGLDPAGAMPGTAARADDSVPRHIMGTQDHCPPGHTVTGVSPVWRTGALVAGAASVALAITLIMTGVGGLGSWPAFPAGNPGSNPFEYVRLELTGNAPAPLADRVDDCQTAVNQGIRDKQDAPPPPDVTSPFPPPTDPEESSGTPPVFDSNKNMAGAIWVKEWWGMESSANAQDDHTVVLHRPEGKLAATLTDLGPDLLKVEARDADGTLLGAVDYADGGWVQVHVSTAGVSVEAIGPVYKPGKNGSLTQHAMWLAWSSLFGVVLNGVITPDSDWSIPTTQVLPLVVSASDGISVVGIFSSSVGTAICVTPVAGGPVHVWDESRPNLETPYSAYWGGGTYNEDSGPSGASWGGLGSAVERLTVNLDDGTSVEAQVGGQYWLAVYSHAASPSSLTTTLTDGRTNTISVV